MRRPPLPAAMMASAADAEVTAALSHCVGPPPFGEVATVAHIVTHAAPAIAAAWTPLLAAHGCTFDLTSVFCHHHPQVSFLHPHSPVELADLLLVIDYHSGGTSTRRAALVQAKMASGGSVLIGPGKPQAQLALLSSWPPFKFRTSGYDPRSRDFISEIASVKDCGRYGAIDLAVTPPAWEQVDPPSALPFVIMLGTQLGRFIAEMADDTSGVGAPADCVTGPPAPTLGDWSFTVAELLHVTYGLVHVAMMRAGSAGGRRGITAITMMSPGLDRARDWRFETRLSAMPADWQSPPSALETEAGPSGPRGISLIHGVIERV